MPSPDPLTAETVAILRHLIGFDTVSRKSNLPLIDWVEARLAAAGVACHRIPDATGQKANLIATLGPADRPGYVLSGHTDVVPVDGQPWTHDPFAARVHDGRVCGRGACDMKGFLACMLAMVPAMQAAPLTRPIHLAFSHDEEVGCIGVRTLLREMAGWPARPLGCFVGEPTQMEVVIGHKAKRTIRVTARGTTAHSSLAPTAVNAIHAAARLIAHIADLADRFRTSGARDALYDIPFTTPHVGAVEGGEVVNIVPDRCSFLYEVRAIGADDPDAITAAIEAHARTVLEPAMQAAAPEAGFDFAPVSQIDGLDTAPEAGVVALAKSFAGKNAHSKVAYGTEAGFFHSITHVPAVVCGPGSIAQAHKADEFIEIAELARCNAFIARLIAHCRD
ncbi:MAG: acetylornithine deacetylase [Thermohalobaculum sp.]|nr:acetylornithine deacetylase [Thermohalobaculum sp.]